MTPRERDAIGQRLSSNEDRRARQRARWAANADAWHQQHAPAPAPVLPRVVVPLGPGAQLAIRNRVTFTFGPLNISVQRFNEAQISAALLRLQSGARSWPDGTMRGIKRLQWKAGQWVSPSMGTVWKDGTCTAADFNESGGLRGEAGIHAVWPDKLEELTGYPGRLVEIAGWGECTVADLGWRAQHARVVRELL